MRLLMPDSKKNQLALFFMLALAEPVLPMSSYFGH